MEQRAAQPKGVQDRTQAGNGAGPVKRAGVFGFWVPLVRAALATTLGVALLIQPDKTRSILANFMGMFWLTSGLMSLRWGASGERPRPLSLVAGAVGVLVGIVALARNLMRGVMSEAVVISLLGGVMLLTGVLHAVGGFRTGEGMTRRWSWPSFLLGLFEVVLGVLLLLSPTEVRPIAYGAAAVWAFVGAFMLLGSALRHRAQMRRSP